MFHAQRGENPGFVRLAQWPSLDLLDHQAKQCVAGIAVTPSPFGTRFETRLAMLYNEIDHLFRCDLALHCARRACSARHQPWRSIGSIIGVAENAGCVLRKLAQSDALAMR